MAASGRPTPKDGDDVDVVQQVKGALSRGWNSFKAFLDTTAEEFDPAADQRDVPTAYYYQDTQELIEGLQRDSELFAEGPNNGRYEFLETAIGELQGYCDELSTSVKDQHSVESEGILSDMKAVAELSDNFKQQLASITKDCVLNIECADAAEDDDEEYASSCSSSEVPHHVVTTMSNRLLAAPGTAEAVPATAAELLSKAVKDSPDFEETDNVEVDLEPIATPVDDPAKAVVATAVAAVSRKVEATTNMYRVLRGELWLTWVPYLRSDYPQEIAPLPIDEQGRRIATHASQERPGGRTAEAVRLVDDYFSEGKDQPVTFTALQAWRAKRLAPPVSVTSVSVVAAKAPDTSVNAAPAAVKTRTLT